MSFDSSLLAVVVAFAVDSLLLAVAALFLSKRSDFDSLDFADFAAEELIDDVQAVELVAEEKRQSVDVVVENCC